MRRFTNILSVFLFVFATAAVAHGQQAAPLPGSMIPQFAQALPLLDLNPQSTTGVPVVLGQTDFILNMHTFKAKMLPVGTITPGVQPETWTFGYRFNQPSAPGLVETAVGPAVVAVRGTPIQIRYVNNLIASDTTIHWREWTDQSLHSAFNQAVGQPMPTPGNPNHYTGPVLAVPHLHGGEVPAVIDGGPEAWFTSNQPGTTAITVLQGPAYYTRPGVSASVNEAVYRYPNTQEAAPIWFHDHLLGGTRLNATYSGLAGAYPIIDPNLNLPTGLDPVGLGGRLSIPLVIQDRMFDINGQLFFPNVGINPEHPYWVPEFVGDTIIVNGKVWPFLNVDQQRYRFYIINGSNSRPYEMFLQDVVSGVKGPRMWVIATDGGYLDNPILIDPNAPSGGTQKALTMMPGERYEIIVDFADPVWQALLPQPATFPRNLILRNTAATVNGSPKPKLDGRIMQFSVSANTPTDTSYNPASLIPIRSGTQKLKRLPGTPLGPAITNQNVQKIRQLTLNEIEGPGGPLEVLVNNSKWNGLRADGTTPINGSVLVKGNYITEFPNEGDTEVWEIVNLTADDHPIHLHGVLFQIVNRQPFNVSRFNTAYAAAFGGVFIPEFGPPLSYAPSTASGGKYGGNPNVNPYLLDGVKPPLNYEQGWKDTVIMPSRHVTRIVARFAPDAYNDNNPFFPYNPSAANGYYVWHCHITDHEDNEMMRPYQDVPNPNAPDPRPYAQGVAY